MSNIHIPKKYKFVEEWAATPSTPVSFVEKISMNDWNEILDGCEKDSVFESRVNRIAERKETEGYDGKIGKDASNQFKGDVGEVDASRHMKIFGPGMGINQWLTHEEYAEKYDKNLKDCGIDAYYTTTSLMDGAGQVKWGAWTNELDYFERGLSSFQHMARAKLHALELFIWTRARSVHWKTVDRHLIGNIKFITPYTSRGIVRGTGSKTLSYCILKDRDGNPAYWASSLESVRRTHSA